MDMTPRERFSEVIRHFDVASRRGSDSVMVHCPCPNHTDKTASVSISIGRKAILIHCFGGCSWQDVAQAAGVDPQFLFYDPPRRPRRGA